MQAIKHGTMGIKKPDTETVPGLGERLFAREELRPYLSSAKTPCAA